MRPKDFRDDEKAERLFEKENGESRMFTKEVLRKLRVADPAELKEKIRATKERFTRNDEVDVLIDIYLFGKGRNINS